MPELQAAFGAAVRKLRLKMGMTQEEFAHRALIDRTYASGIERGQRNPSLKAIGKVADALEVSLPELFREVERRL